jgi:hypothetical protein
LDAAYDAIVAFAEIAFEIEPFKPSELPDDWQSILNSWLRGSSFADLAGYKEEGIIEFIEAALVYRLVWAMEAVRVKQSASQEEEVEESENAGRAALAMETGTSDYAAALLIQGGLASRIAAMKATQDCPADFTNLKGLRRWVHGRCVRDHEKDDGWPTPETASLWRTFVSSLSLGKLSKWSAQEYTVPVEWFADCKQKAPAQLRFLYDPATKRINVYSIDMCHRSLQNQPIGVESKPATLRC